MCAIDYNPIVKEIIKLPKNLNYHFTHHYFDADNGTILCASKKTQSLLISLEEGYMTLIVDFAPFKSP